MLHERSNFNGCWRLLVSCVFLRIFLFHTSCNLLFHLTMRQITINLRNRNYRCKRNEREREEERGETRVFIDCKKEKMCAIWMECGIAKQSSSPQGTRSNSCHGSVTRAIMRIFVSGYTDVHIAASGMLRIICRILCIRVY